MVGTSEERHKNGHDFSHTCSFAYIKTHRLALDSSRTEKALAFAGPFSYNENDIALYFCDIINRVFLYA